MIWYLIPGYAQILAMICAFAIGYEVADRDWGMLEYNVPAKHYRITALEKVMFPWWNNS